MNRGELEKLMSDSGVGPRTTRKVLSEFDRQHGGAPTEMPSRPSRPRGHGAPASIASRVSPL